MIKELRGVEILDSRGRPAVKAYCLLDNGITAAASVPSGASTGKAEAVELRDGDPGRYRGLGCHKAVANINGLINKECSGRKFEQQEDFDMALKRLDGTENKSRLGANAILACSLAFARAQSVRRGEALYRYFGGLINNSDFALPTPTVNLFSGGKHAGAQVPIQDLLLIPLAATDMSLALEQVWSVYQRAASLIFEKYGTRALKADEGGLAPSFNSINEMFDVAVQSIELAGLKPGVDMAIAVDVASSHFYREGKYFLGDDILDSRVMIDRIKSWVLHYPLLSVEDGLAEDDWQYWPELKLALQDRCLVLGDDLLCTQAARIKRAVESKAANALLLKVNQCGTVTEAATARQLAAQAGWQITVSARSGETEDDWLADLAVGWAANQIKIGSVAQSDRLAKYNRLLEIEAFHRSSLRQWNYPGNKK